MQCIRPLKSSFDSKGNRTYRQSEMMPGLVASQFECRKCLPCRLNIAREKAIRCFHESQMHENNIFLTLTYDDQKLGHKVNPRLQYIDFQIFMDSLRQKITRNVTDKELRKKLRISYMVTGEYGELNKRPHWHAILFNYAPPDAKYIRTTDRKERVYTSILLSDLWGKGAIEYGSVTIDSAGYVARYAAKKLVHGHDQDHEYHPIHKTSKGRAIGRSWIEKYHEFTFQNGFVVLPNKSCAKIPRYYLDWYKKYYPTEWERYVTEIRTKSISLAEEKMRKEEAQFWAEVWSKPHGFPNPLTRSQVKETILKSKFKQLQERLKL